MKKLVLLMLLSSTIAGFAHAQSTVTDSLISEGLMRYYNLYIPKNYVAGSHRPLIIHLHGYSSNGAIEQLYTNYMPIADTAGFLVAYPEGTKDGSGYQFWNSGIPGLPTTPNDVAFLSALIDSLHAHYNIDLSRVYASGLSNGGYMCYQLAWMLSNKITAIASVSGSMAPVEFAKCKPVQAVPVMEIHGTADQTVSYTSSPISTDIDTLLDFWVKSDGCIPLAGISDLPDIDPSDGSTVIHYEWSAEIKNTTCELYKIVGGAHVDWPGSGTGNNGDFKASQAIWNFFNKYRLNQFSDVKENVSRRVSSNIYPNPCSDIIHVSGDESGTVTFTDFAGRNILTSRGKDIDVSKLPSGIYLLQFQYEGIQLPQRVKLLKF